MRIEASSRETLGREPTPPCDALYAHLYFFAKYTISNLWFLLHLCRIDHRPKFVIPVIYPSSLIYSDIFY